VPAVTSPATTSFSITTTRDRRSTAQFIGSQRLPSRDVTGQPFSGKGLPDVGRNRSRSRHHLTRSAQGESERQTEKNIVAMVKQRSGASRQYTGRLPRILHSPGGNRPHIETERLERALEALYPPEAASPQRSRGECRPESAPGCCSLITLPDYAPLSRPLITHRVHSPAYGTPSSIHETGSSLR
jgi:hypothetical protein